MKRQLWRSNSIMTQFLIEMSGSLKRWVYSTYCHFRVNVFLPGDCVLVTMILTWTACGQKNTHVLWSQVHMYVYCEKKRNVSDELKQQHNEKDPEISLIIKLHCCRCRLFNNALLNVLLFRDGVSYVSACFPRVLEPDVEETRVFRPWSCRPHRITWQLQIQMFFEEHKATTGIMS